MEKTIIAVGAGQPVPTGDPPSPVPPSLWDWLRREIVKPGAGLLLAGTIPLLLVFANTQIKELVEHFLGGCVFVLDKQVTSKQQFLVKGYLSGTPPKIMPLRFEARQGSLDLIAFDEIDSDQAGTENLSRHPLQGQTCPGQLCLEEEARALRGRKIIFLSDLRPEFSYNFLIWLKDNPPAKRLDAHMLSVVAVFPSGLEGGICRVEAKHWFNFWVWASALQKCAFFLSILVSGGLLLRWARATGS
jgi:hypothetical protein